ncbi:MAG: hypothetical protein ACM3UY_04170 [Methanocella sp.]
MSLMCEFSYKIANPATKMRRLKPYLNGDTPYRDDGFGHPNAGTRMWT